MSQNIQLSVFQVSVKPAKTNWGKRGGKRRRKQLPIPRHIIFPSLNPLFLVFFDILRVWNRLTAVLQHLQVSTSWALAWGWSLGSGSFAVFAFRVTLARRTRKAAAMMMRTIAIALPTARKSKGLLFFCGRTSSVMVPVSDFSTSPPMLGNMWSTITLYFGFKCSCTNSSMIFSNFWHCPSRAHRRSSVHISCSMFIHSGTLAVSLLKKASLKYQKYPVREVTRRIAAISGRYSLQLSSWGQNAVLIGVKAWPAAFTAPSHSVASV